MKLLVLLLVFVFSLGPHVVLAQVDPGTSLIPACLTLSPGDRFPGNPIGANPVWVNDVTGAPVEGATVTITFSPGAVSILTWCGGGGPPVLTGVTGPDGMILFELFGAGCIDAADPDHACATPAATVDVTGPVGVGGSFSVDIPCVRSPDVAGVSGATNACPATSTCENGRTDVGLSDIVFHTPAMRSGIRVDCSKIAAPFVGTVTLQDLVLITPYGKRGSSCGC